MKLTANERLTVISLLAGPRTLDGVIRFVDASPEHMAKTLVPNLVHHHVLRRIPTRIRPCPSTSSTTIRST